MKDSVIKSVIYGFVGGTILFQYFLMGRPLDLVAQSLGYFFLGLVLGYFITETIISGSLWIAKHFSQAEK